MDSERRGGRGDRVGRYGNTLRFQNYQDQDYRDYEQEDEEYSGYDSVLEDRSIAFERLSGGVCNFSQGYFQHDHFINQDGDIPRNEYEHPTDYDNHILRHGAKHCEADRFPQRPEKRKRVPGGVDEYVPEEMRDQDYRADLDYNQKPSHIVMLRMLPPNATTNEIRAELLEQGIQPKEVRLMRNKTSGETWSCYLPNFLQLSATWLSVLSDTNYSSLQIKL